MKSSSIHRNHQKLKTIPCESLRVREKIEGYRKAEWKRRGDREEEGEERGQEQKMRGNFKLEAGSVGGDGIKGRKEGRGVRRGTRSG